MQQKFGDSFIKGAGFAVGLAVVLSFYALMAQSLTSFNAGDVVSASTINANFLIAAPEGTISAFHLSACPNGWVAADGTGGTPDLRGRFIRGRDDAGSGAAGVDPSGVRAVGDEQMDAFQGHYHSHDIRTATGGTDRNATIGRGTTTGGTVDTIVAQDPITDGANGTPRISDETRPRNVALIFCMRRDG